jgi:hypothetical protein
MKQLRIYIAGPLHTSGNPDRNVRKAIMVADQVVACGHVPFIPHLNVLWNMVTEVEYRTEQWLSYDKAWLLQCHLVIRLPGDFLGADEEVGWATKLGLPVLYWDDSLCVCRLYVQDAIEQVIRRNEAKHGRA